jgi:Ca2+-binding EF-hand superfamily protein
MKMLFTTVLLSLSMAVLPTLNAKETLTPEQKDKLQTVLEQRFAQADANKDGQVTRNETQGVMPRLFRNFEHVDADHSDTVTMAEIQQAIAAKLAQSRY